METFKMGLIGCGGMMGAHVKGINEMDGIEIVAVCDIVRSQAEAVSTALGTNPKIYTDYRDMLDDVDGVLIALPHDLHFECGMFFALHHKHIMMEKPLCNSEEECLKLIETCEAENVTLMCAYPVRFWRGIVKLKEMIDSGEFGKIMQMSIWTEQLTGFGYNYLQEAGDKGKVWQITSRLGGGQLFSHGCHYIDILLWFLGDPIEGAHLGTNVGTPWMLREGTSSVIMKFKNGAIAYHGATWGARGTRLGCDFQIQTEGGMIEYLHREGEIRVYNRTVAHVPGEIEKNDGYSVVWKRDTELSKETQFETKHFLDCVREGKEPLTSGRKALQSLRVIWAMYNAEKNGIMADLRGLGLEDA